MIAEFLNWFLTTTTGRQIKNSLDEITKEKIIKGAVWSFLDAGVAALGAYIVGVEVSEPMLAVSFAWFGPFIINAWNEYRKGEREYSI